MKEKEQMTLMASRTKQLAYMGMMIAVAMAASYFEACIPAFVPVPGVKLGLANAVVIVVMSRHHIREAAIISAIRIVLSACLFSGLFSMVYSLAGATLSLLTMWFIYKRKWFSTVGVSVAGGVMHNVGQLVVAMLVLEAKTLIYYFPILLFSGVIAGIVIGVLSAVVIQKLNHTGVQHMVE